MESTHDQPGTTAETLRGLFEATATATGEDFFRLLVRQLAESLDARTALIAEYFSDHGRARTLALYDNGEYLGNVEYPVALTPCESVLQGDIHQVKEGLQDRYPGEGFEGILAESYLGIPLIGRSGAVIGHVVVLDEKPMHEVHCDFSSLEILARRATAELERLQVEEKMAATHARLLVAERQAARGQLTAGIAHEINSPLGVINSNAQLAVRSSEHLRSMLDGDVLSDPSLKRETGKHLAALLKTASASLSAGRRIEEVVTGLKRFTRTEEAEFKDYDVHEGLEAALGLLRPSLKKQVTVVTAYESIPKIRCQPVALNEVFFTVLKNAGEAIQDSGRISIATSENNRKIRVEVADEGKGIPADEISRIFDVGFNVKGKRMGLRAGLAHSRDIIVGLGGEIDIQSEVGVGTEVRIQLPVHQLNVN